MSRHFFKVSKKSLCCTPYPNRAKAFKYLLAPVKTAVDETKLPPPTKINNKTIDYLERISLVGFENEKAVQIVEGAIRFADQIFEVNTDGVEPLITVLENECLHLREDIPKNSITRSELLSHSTKTFEYYYVTPTGDVKKTTE